MSTEDGGPPTFATNRNGETVANAINQLLGGLVEKLKQPPELSIASAYFNPAGFSLLADSLESLGPVRVLLGAEAERDVAQLRHVSDARSPQREEQATVRDALSGHQKTIEQDRDLLGFDLEADASAKRLVRWLSSAAVEVRRFNDGFLHGKAFIVTSGDHAVIAGSSNFTYAGLARNHELNLGHYQPETVDRVRGWFDALWDESEPYDLAAIYDARYQPHEPYLIYLRMLYERYVGEVEQEARSAGTGIRLTGFQEDGVWRAKRILEERNGVVVADGVGLGKTFIAGELIREAVRDRRQRVLVVAPAALRDGPWKHFLHKYELPVQCVSFEELSADPRLNPDSDSEPKLMAELNEYGLVVIDEAHAYRTPETQRAAALRALLRGSPPKGVVMLSATPVNNSLWDLYYLLTYFIHSDSAFADAGILSLRGEFAEAMAENPDDLSPDQLFDVLDAVSVRRTRHFVKTYYPHDQVDGKPIIFPRPHVAPVAFDLADTYGDLLPTIDHALGCWDDSGCEHELAISDGPTLTLARYAPSRYRRKGKPETHELQLAGLLRSGLLKRFESSAHSFSLTCERMAASHDHFLALMAEGHVATGEALREWAATDGDDVEDLIDGGGDIDDASAYDIEALENAATADRELLRNWAKAARAVTPDKDPKLAALVDKLAAIATQAADEAIGEEDERDKRKVLVFSYFADTVGWIGDYLEKALDEREDLGAYCGRMTRVTGSDVGRSKVLFGFAPESSEAPSGTEDRYDLLITTDVLAEGVNLQQARHIINYDLPWNPMRLVQRHGRIDRIGSSHSDVYLHCFLPDKQLDGLLKLEQMLQRKLKRAAAAVGVESEVIPGSAVSEQTFAETRDEVERLREKDASLFETGGERAGAYSGEEYRQALRAGLQDPRTAELVKALPWGSGSGLARSGDKSGFVFCARVGDYPRAQFRYVPTDPGDGVDPGEIVDDTLTCLAHSHAETDAVRVLDEATHAAAYTAWTAAREDIFDRWQKATDPANLQPRIPKVLRDAVALLREHSPTGFEQRELDRVVESLEAPYGTRIQRFIRDAIRESEVPAEQAAAVVKAAQDLGLEPAPAPDPLPVIELDDVHLVCWMAIVADGD